MRENCRWEGPMRRYKAWEGIGADAYLVRQIRYGIYDPPSIPFTEGRELGRIPMTAVDQRFAREDLATGIREGVYEELSRDYAMAMMREGAMISSAFVVRKSDTNEPRFVINLHHQSKHWETKSVKMETLAGYVGRLRQGDNLLSWDLKGGYRHFRLHPDMRKYFIFAFENRYYQCVALPFGWGPSVYWFTKLLKPYTRWVRERLKVHLLHYIDDFLGCPRPDVDDRPSTKAQCQITSRKLDELHEHLGLTRHPNKGSWEGTQVVEHLGFLVDTVSYTVQVLPRKVRQVEGLAARLIRECYRNRGHVLRDAVERFCGVLVALTLGFPLARFYTRSLYTDLKKSGNSVHVRLAAQSLHDLKSLRNFDPGDGRKFVLPVPRTIVHADASDIGYGGTLNYDDQTPGADGIFRAQGIWEASDRREIIALRELRALRLLLQYRFADYILGNDVLVYEDNYVVTRVLHHMVSASDKIMSELRRLHAWLKINNIRIRAEWLPSAQNRYADLLSRTIAAGSELRMSASLAAELSTTTATLNIPKPVLAKLQVDQLKLSWAKHTMVWIPPLELLPLVVAKIVDERASGVLVCPRWRNQNWYQEALSLGHEHKVVPPGPFQYRGHSGSRRWETSIIVFTPSI
jgi:hypothetical protein